MTKIKRTINFATLSVLLFSGHTFAIDRSYIDQITCKNWRTQLNEPMAFPSFVATLGFQKEFIQIKTSEEDQGDYYSDIFKPRLPHKIFNSQILAVTTDAGYGGEWASAGFSVNLKGKLDDVLAQAQEHLKVLQWQTTLNKYSDDNGIPVKTQVYYAIQPYHTVRQARYVSISQNLETKAIQFECRAAQGDIPMFIRNMSGNWDY